MTNKPLLLFQGPVRSRSGYGDHTRDLLVSLIGMDKFDVRIAATKWGDCPETGLEGHTHSVLLESKILTTNQIEKKPDVYIMCSVPNEFNPIGTYNIGITAGIETTIADPSWIEGCNRMNMIIVPSKHSKDTLTNSVYSKMDDRTRQQIGELRIETPIEVLFEGADLQVFKDLETYDELLDIDSSLNSVAEDFNFLYVGHWLDGKIGHDRKDTGMLIKTFCEAFDGIDDAPGLILKTSMATFSVIDRNRILAKVDEIKSSFNNPPNVYVLHGDLTPQEMNGLYNHPKIKAHISFTKGEGFGRPLLEATLSGKPVIASAWSGQLDFLNPNFSTLLPGDLKDVHRSAQWKGVINEGTQWFYVNYPIAEKVIRDVYSNYSRYETLAIKQKQYSIDNFSLEKMKSEFVKIIEKYIKPQDVPQQVNISLPKLKKANNNPKLKLPQLKKV